jgi:hypothetical protein
MTSATSPLPATVTVARNSDQMVTVTEMRELDCSELRWALVGVIDKKIKAVFRTYDEAYDHRKWEDKIISWEIYDLWAKPQGEYQKYDV